MTIMQHHTHMPSANSPSTDYRGPRGQLKHHCGLCKQVRSKLSVCTGCNAVRYCSREHQVEDRPDHKSQCSKIKRLRTKLVKEEELVRNAPPDFMTPANIFETQVGHFWGILETRDYMRARFALADALRRLGTLDGVREALSHFEDMMRLCRSDNMGVRDLIPAMMLQLDRDQDCYDFVKWYETEGQRSDYDWGDMDLPFLDVKDANTLESIDFMEGKFGSLSFVSAVMLLKMKLIVDCSTVRLTRQVLAGRLPVELWRNVETHVVRSPISAQFCLKNSKQLATVEDNLSTHIRRLGNTLGRKNEHFLSGLLEPDDVLNVRPEYYSSGSVEEMILVLQYSFAAYWQHEGVLELLVSARTIAAKDSECEIDGMMGGSTFKSQPGSDRTRAELLDDVSRNRLWGYMDWAIEDSRSLCDEKPSERHMRKIHNNWDTQSESEDEDGDERTYGCISDDEELSES